MTTRMLLIISRYYINAQCQQQRVRLTSSKTKFAAVWMLANKCPAVCRVESALFMRQSMPSDANCILLTKIPSKFPIIRTIALTHCVLHNQKKVKYHFVTTGTQSYKTIKQTQHPRLATCHRKEKFPRKHAAACLKRSSSSYLLRRFMRAQENYRDGTT